MRPHEQHPAALAASPSAAARCWCEITFRRCPLLVRVCVGSVSASPSASASPSLHLLLLLRSDPAAHANMECGTTSASCTTGCASACCCCCSQGAALALITREGSAWTTAAGSPNEGEGAAAVKGWHCLDLEGGAILGPKEKGCTWGCVLCVHENPFTQGLHCAAGAPAARRAPLRRTSGRGSPPTCRRASV